MLMLTHPVLPGESHHALPLDLKDYKDSAFHLDLSVGGMGHSLRPQRSKIGTNMEITGSQCQLNVNRVSSKWSCLKWPVLSPDV